MSNRKSFIIFILMLVAGFSGYLALRHQQAEQKPHLAQKASAEAQDIHALSFNKQGQLSSEVKAPSMQQSDNGKTSRFASPVITLYTANKQPWHITAKTGIAKSHFAAVTLIGHVILHQAAGTNNGETTITTEQLKIYPQKKIAITHQPITVVQHNPGHDNAVIHAVGARLNQNTGQIHFLSHTHITYEPASKT